ncbi:hypothetical protein TRV_07655 [Trichophyton verrucosum HKI 0517]|uniref:Secreted protein n=1 Tax=Trichophyton verrucosum (strain HKI 0517) TaxID=663202 RepID=D4DKD3_TRIVH|nr:uncharacterized protein TRV_07655 [Trichophyton verrucosum HKI 0517]EFE37692.1 hypothetical protein TRV_07655 [Trichophyton verrucosum HKI 0517]
MLFPSFFLTLTPRHSIKTPLSLNLKSLEPFSLAFAYLPFKMRTSILFSIAASLLGASAQAVEAPIKGYGVEPFSWEVKATANGPPLTLNGTVEEVHSQLLKINPNYDIEMATSGRKREHARDIHGLFKRDNVICGRQRECSRKRIEEGIAYLYRVPGRPTNGPGPGNCGRVSCSYDSAIWWCNDNTFTKVLPGFYNVAEGAQLILNTCNPGGSYVSGQDFHDDKWNVIVQYTQC